MPAKRNRGEANDHSRRASFTAIARNYHYCLSNADGRAGLSILGMQSLDQVFGREGTQTCLDFNTHDT